MSNMTILRLNAKLSAAFCGYASEHPDVLKKVPRNACIVFATTANRRLSKINEGIAKEVMKKDNRHCYVAKQSSRGWKVMKIG